MKYIRTKDDKIYYMGDLDKSEILNRKPFVHRKTQKLIYPTYIKQEADTIQELCDELVVHNPSNDGYFSPKHFVYQNKWETMLKPISDYQKSKGIEIYGAVWTDEGLIYVAKMNKKGELELL